MVLSGVYFTKMLNMGSFVLVGDNGFQKWPRILMNQQLSAHVDCCFLIPEFGYAGNFWLHRPRNAMTLLDGCRAMPEKSREKVRCDECKMTIPILLSL